MSKQIVEANDTLSVHYTGKLTDGTIFDSSISREPLTFKLGEGSLIEGFETGVIGMEVGETKEVFIPFDKAYGQSHPELLGEIPMENLPQDIFPEVGMVLMVGAPDGTERQIVITGVGENSIEVDANHPLSGKDLIFEIELLSIQRD
ncbi:MAG: peptidylprolyl isomerase [Flavobacteriaceae bacterium]|nr:MAG: peptidylprolyl isomerase [Flavobacteriaceae bacterium]